MSGKEDTEIMQEPRSYVEILHEDYGSYLYVFGAGFFSIFTLASLILFVHIEFTELQFIAELERQGAEIPDEPPFMFYVNLFFYVSALIASVYGYREARSEA